MLIDHELAITDALNGFDPSLLTQQQSFNECPVLCHIVRGLADISLVTRNSLIP